MTREEAINKAINIISYFEAHFAKSKEAREEAVNIIEALEQEPCEDAISRAEALRQVKEWRNDEFLRVTNPYYYLEKRLNDMPPVKPQESKTEWIPVSERLPETDNENRINDHNVLLLVKDKSHPEREPQIYLGKLRHIDGNDGSGNFWGIKTKPCDWTIWGWSYFNEPEVIAWQPLPLPLPLPEPYKMESEV